MPRACASLCVDDTDAVYILLFMTTTTKATQHYDFVRSLSRGKSFSIFTFLSQRFSLRVDDIQQQIELNKSCYLNLKSNLRPHPILFIIIAFYYYTFYVMVMVIITRSGGVSTKFMVTILFVRYQSSVCLNFLLTPIFISLEIAVLYVIKFNHLFSHK